MTERSCGTCVACCTYLAIEELDKPGMRQCPHLDIMEPPPGQAFMGSDTEHNCGVHGTDERPACCETYKCGWLLGGGNDDDRPDKSLMLIDVVSGRGIQGALEVKPLRDRQQDTDRGRAVADRMSRFFQRPAVVFDFYEKRPLRLLGRGVE